MLNKIRGLLIAGNWKMYKTANEAITFIEAFTPLIQPTFIEQNSCKIYLAVPFTAIQSSVEAAKNSPITIGAQNMSDASEGAFTGEISAKMLIDAGAKFVILGHSERRQYFHETNAFINRKVKKALSDGLQPILCFGETAQERESGQTEEVIKKQLEESLAGISPQEMAKVVLAYEPVWAIGTGQTATPDIAQEIHSLCRQELLRHWQQEVAEQTLILYGGSAKPENAAAILAQPDIDGLLVGGASLAPETFAKLVNSSIG